MRVLVTRPAAQAVAWAARLSARGVDAHALPLIDIVPPQDPAAVVAAWRGLSGRRLAFFVSPNAVDRFFALRPADLAWPAATIAASPGPGTTQGLRSHGVAAASIVEPASDAPQFDSESLWVQLQGRDWHGARVLAVRGTRGRDWLVDRLTTAGAEVDVVSAYARAPARWSADEAALADAALADPAAHLWFFSSSEAIEHLALLRPGIDWRQAQAIATHPRIADTARRLGFGAVRESRPTLDAVVACIQSRAS